MFFGYPVAATADNWFHECMVEILIAINSKKQVGQVVPEWPEIIPEEYKARLITRTGLRDRLIIYRESLEGLSNAELDSVSDALNMQNEISRLLSGECNCETIDELPVSVRRPIIDLFKFGFELLTDLGIRDSQYQVIYERTPSHVCPFCGCELFDAPGAPREALDHYLVESKYPFAAANLKNLIPMGNKCNSRYKLAQDILYDNEGRRRHSSYPYNIVDGVQISLLRSEPFAGTDSLFPLPNWQVDFEPASEEVSTWDTVFQIEERLKRDVLDADFMSWLGEFSVWCRDSVIRPISQEKIADALLRYSDSMRENGIKDRAFLKAAVFQMLHHYYQQGNQRLIDLVNGVVVGRM
jgi:hypothetical protein